MQTDSPAAVSAGQGAMRGHPVGVILGRGWQGWAGACLKLCLTPFVHKSKLPLFAATVPQALLLLLLLTISTFATAENDHEIGLPQAMETKINDCFGAYLSPKEDRFYTVHEGMLTQYQISPFRKLGSVTRLGLVPLDSEAIKKSGCHVLVTNDEKKLIVVSPNWIYLFDLGTGRLLKKSEWEYRSFPAIIINNDELLILGRFFIGNDSYGEYAADLAIWDIDALKLKEKKLYKSKSGENFGFIQDAGGFPTMSKILDRIYMKSDKSLLILNSKTYVPELSLLFGPSTDNTGIPTPMPRKFLAQPRLSKNFQILYAGSASKVTDYLTGKEADLRERKKTDVLVFDQKTRQFKIDRFESLNLDALDPYIINRNVSSRNRNYVMLLSDSFHARASPINLNTNVRGGFHQYEAGEAILQRCSNFFDCKEFQLTPGAKKYLMMKNLAGKVVPINDATFNKYYRSDGLFQ